MKKWHVNDSGEPMECEAQSDDSCPFGKDDIERHMYAKSKEDVRDFAEKVTKQLAGKKEISSVRREKADTDSSSSSDFLQGGTSYNDVDKTERAKQMIADLEDAVVRMVEEGKLVEYFDAMSKVSGPCKSWSLQNTLLATMQLRHWKQRNGLPVSDDPLQDLINLDARGVKQWNEVGRKITSGKGSALYILVPMIGKKDLLDKEGKPKLDENGKPMKTSYVYGFKSVPVFALEQTDGDPLPEIPEEKRLVNHLEGEVDKQKVADLKKLIESSGYTYVEKEIAGTDPETLTGTLGYTTKSDSSGKAVVVIDPRLPETTKASVIAHELSHIKMGHLDDGAPSYREHRGQMETEAEGMAYVLMRSMGLNKESSESFSPGYIASWSKGDKTLLRKALSKVTDRFKKTLVELGW